MRLQKRVLDALFKFLKIFEDMTGIIKIAKNIEADDPKRKLGSALQ